MNALLSVTLCYHGVSNTWESPLAVRPDQFKKHICMLIAAGYHAGTIEEVLRARRRVFHVTFDDGFKSILEVCPFLRSLTIPFTIFICSAYRGTVIVPELSDDLAAQRDEFAALTWDELRELAREGVEIGSHGLSHRRFTELTDEALRSELAASKLEIEHEIGRACRYVSYPYGSYNARVVGAAANAGFEAGWTMSAGPLQRTLLSAPRIGVYRRDSARRLRAKTLLGVRLTRQVVFVGRQQWQQKSARLTEEL